MKKFNTTGKCIASQHYMVPIDRQVDAAAKLVEEGMYFCINRGRQYGKTTTLSFLQQRMENQGYVVFSISFEGLPDSAFSTTETLLYTSLELMEFPLELTGIKNLPDTLAHQLQETLKTCKGTTNVMDFRRLVASICSQSRVVLIIDEVDQAGNFPQFLQFLGILRSMFLKRDTLPTFQSVILAGVYDIKNLKLRVRSEVQHQYNSPWNIAAPFDTDMSLSADGIANMLSEYKDEHHLDFEEKFLAQMIYDYTSGYPYLVSRLCQIIDERNYTWDKEGILKSVHAILIERNTLFDDMIKKIEQFPQLGELLKDTLFSGRKRTYTTDERYIQIASMFNFVKDADGTVVINSRLMETRLYNYFIGEEEESSIYSEGQLEKNQFIHDGSLDMRRILERFIVHFNEIYHPEKDVKFIEENGRKIFLTYLRPIINGIGNYYCEARTRDLTRTDVIIDYLGQQYIVELKIWRGNSYNERGEAQLFEYLDSYHQKMGYLVSFCLNKNKQTGIRDVIIKDKTIIEAIV